MKFFLIIILILTITTFVAFPSIDLYISNLFYFEETGFIYREQLFSEILYFSIKLFTAIILIISFFILGSDFLKYKNIKIPYEKHISKLRQHLNFTWQQALYVMSVILITPGIIVHWIAKPLWSRSRPVNITEFGGSKEFTPIYEIMTGQNGNSFPSGHASMSFAFIALIYIFPKYKATVTAMVIPYAIAGSMCRVWQGGHYLSDVSVSAVITLWTIYFCKIYILDNEKLQNLQSNIKNAVDIKGI